MTDKNLTGAENIRWNLTDLYQSIDDPKMDEDLARAVKMADEFQEKYQGKLGDLTPAQLHDAYQEIITLTSTLYHVGQFAGLILSTNNGDEQAKALDARVDEISSKIQNKLVFLELELGAMPAETYAPFSDAPELKDFRYKLCRIRETASHHLTEKEEQVINLKKLTGSGALTKLYDELTSAFEFDFTVDGETRKWSGDEMRALRQHPDPQIRREAMRLFLERYQEHRIVFTHIYNNVVKDFNIDKDLRKYSSAINVMNVGNDLDDVTVQTLMEVTSDSNRLVNRYYKIKQKMLALDDLSLADIYAPLPDVDKKYPWEEGKELVLEAFKSFDDDFHNYAYRMFSENRIDAPAVPLKRGGAFCSYAAPDRDPYVFLNYTGRLRDVSTLAHELGHAIHGYISQEQNLVNYHSILPLAETASVFSEMILTDRFLKNETDPRVKQALLTGKLEDIFSTSHRQNMFSRFELVIHKTMGERLMSGDELCAVYHEELERMFGDSVQYPKEYDWEWSTIPHMLHVPFYVYAYNFANLLVLALYQQYLEEGTSFIPKLKSCLALGSAARPTDIIAVTGQDVNHPDFWQKSVVYIESLIDQLEDLITS